MTRPIKNPTAPDISTVEAITAAPRQEMIPLMIMLFLRPRILVTGEAIIAATIPRRYREGSCTKSIHKSFLQNLSKEFSLMYKYSEKKSRCPSLYVTPPAKDQVIRKHWMVRPLPSPIS